MRFPPLQVLQSADPTTAFILLIWQELFADDTPDSFQPRQQNIPALIQELREVGQLALESSHWVKHVDEIKSELKHILADSAALVDNLPKYRWAIEDLLKTADVRQVERQARMIEYEYPGFDAFYTASLHQAVSKMPKEKGNLSNAIANLASYAARTGLSRAHLLTLATDDKFSLSPSETVKSLCSLIHTVVRPYSFIAAFNGNIIEIQAVIRKLQQLTVLRKDARPSDLVAHNFFETHQEATFVFGVVEGSGQVDAARAALRIARPVADTLNFFNNAEIVTVCDDVLITEPDQGPSTLINLEHESLHRLRPRKRARALSNDTLRDLFAGQLRGRLLNALELHSLAHGSAAPRVRLVNLWSALECLIGSRNEGSIIKNAVALIAPLLARRRVEKIVRYLAISTHDYRKGYNLTLPVNAGFDHSTTQRVSCEDLLTILVKPTQHPYLVALSNHTENHSLLRFRHHRAWQALSDPTIIAREIKGSEQRVQWQLFRIYRARNQTVHHGENVGSAGALLDTLHYYFSTLLARVLYLLAANPKWELDDALASLSRESRYIRDTLERTPSKLVLRDFILDTTIRADESLWPLGNSSIVGEV